MKTASSERVGRLENRRERGHGVASSGRRVTRGHYTALLRQSCTPRHADKEAQEDGNRKKHRAETESAYLVANGSGAWRWW